MNNNIFSGIRLRQILNDLKRRPEDASKELKISKKKINNILKGKQKLDLRIIKKMIKIWPVSINSFINYNFLTKKDPQIIICKCDYSKKTSRIMKRGGIDYYEYRDTAMARFAPFRPEWIRTICKVKNNKANNSKVIWNKGHLLHQFTYFVGNINFYYLNSKGKKKVSLMKTGDTMYISPYVPHSFASRDSKTNFIIALTYLDKITNEVQENLSHLGEESSKNIINNSNELIERYASNSFLNKDKLKIKNKLKESNLNTKIRIATKYSKALNINIRDLLTADTNKKVEIKKATTCRSWLFPSKRKRIFFVKELASSKYVPEGKSFEIKVLKNNNLINENHCHQYLYVLSDNLTLKINSKKYNFKKDDTFYLKPFTKFCFINKGAKILILRVSDSMSGENLLQLSQIGKKNIQRVIMENKKWF